MDHSSSLEPPGATPEGPASPSTAPSTGSSSSESPKSESDSCWARGVAELTVAKGDRRALRSPARRVVELHSRGGDVPVDLPAHVGQLLVREERSASSCARHGCRQRP